MLMTLILLIINSYLHGTCQKYIPLNDASFHFFISSGPYYPIGVFTPVDPLYVNTFNTPSATSQYIVLHVDKALGKYEV